MVPREPPLGLKSCAQMVNVNSSSNSLEEIVSESICSNSCCSNFGHQVQDEKNMNDEGFTIKSPSSSRSIVDSVMKDTENVEEELFLFSDIDEPKVIEVKRVESNFPADMDRGNSRLCSAEGIKELSESVSKNKESYMCPEISDQEKLSSDYESSIGSLKASSNPMGIPRSCSISGNEVGPLAESLPTMSSCFDNCIAFDSLSNLLDSKSKSLKWTLQCNTLSSRNPSGDTEPQLALELSFIKDAPVLGELKHDPVNSAVGKKTWIIVSGPVDFCFHSLFPCCVENIDKDINKCGHTYLLGL